jgi:glucose-6-phosphate 1-dehydrogenase
MSSARLQQPLVLVIFGITGDLAQRKLLPALYQLAKANELPEATKIIGISRRRIAKDDVFAKLKEFTGEKTYDDTVQAWLAEKTDMVQMDLLHRGAYEDLLAHLQKIEESIGSDASRLYYLSIPSQAFAPIVRLLGETRHNMPLPGGRDMARLLIEKPFGYDLQSASELIDAVNEYFGEGQIYRIDHYVAKETVQNILTFRFQNPLFESVWNSKHVDHISIVAHEKIGIEGRAGFYEQTGALRDLVQSHLLQLLAVTTMDRPAKLESDEIHAEKLKLLKAIVPIAPNKVASDTVRGQYEGYRTEVNDDNSIVETFARLTVAIDNPVWRGVPIILETGKALDEKLTEITVCFKQADDAHDIRNKLVFRIQPTEGITLLLQVKRPGIDNETEEASMDFDYTRSFNNRPAEAYERVIIDAIRGDQTLFASADEVIASWRIIENVLEQWSHNADGLKIYPKVSTSTTI